MGMVKAIIIITAVLLVLIFTFFHYDYEETAYPDVLATRLENNNLELTFVYKAKVSGNMHGPSLPFDSETFDSAKWFYFGSDSGLFDAEKIVLTRYKRCKDSAYWQKNMRGKIILSPTTVTFSLEMPRYTYPEGENSTEVISYVNWEHNGEYNLVSELAPSLNILVEDYRPTSCDPTVVT